MDVYDMLLGFGKKMKWMWILTFIAVISAIVFDFFKNEQGFAYYISLIAMGASFLILAAIVITAFIKDWREETKEERKKFIIIWGAILVILLFMLIFLSRETFHMINVVISTAMIIILTVMVPILLFMWWKSRIKKKQGASG